MRLQKDVLVGNWGVVRFLFYLLEGSSEGVGLHRLTHDVGRSVTIDLGLLILEEIPQWHLIFLIHLKI